MQSNASMVLQQLYFPIYFHGHWFVIVVQLKEKKFVIFDSCIRVFGEHSTYHKNVMKLFKPNFIKLWQETVIRDMGFLGFITSFADVPQHDVEDDSGVFIMNFLELLEPSVNVKEKFGQSDIPNIRKKYVHDMIFYKANEEVDDVDILKNYDQQVFAKYFQD
uniref:Ubiquitin-like protease family profile domain-containing protein n=1 Tax=Arundo donax TaxID=35708 RepID=A0A0A9CH92_ARUDO